MAGVPAYLKALTPEAKACLGSSMNPIAHFPYRIGRDSRVGAAVPVERSRRRPESAPNNDLYLLEAGPVFNVSREHLQIEFRDGKYILSDRGSACGTIVEGEIVGADRRGGERKLESNDVFIVGTSESRYVFKFVVADAP